MTETLQGSCLFKSHQTPERYHSPDFPQKTQLRMGGGGERINHYTKDSEGFRAEKRFRV